MRDVMSCMLRLFCSVITVIISLFIEIFCHLENHKCSCHHLNSKPFVQLVVSTPTSEGTRLLGSIPDRDTKVIKNDTNSALIDIQIYS